MTTGDIRQRHLSKRGRERPHIFVTRSNKKLQGVLGRRSRSRSEHFVTFDLNGLTVPTEPKTLYLYHKADWAHINDLVSKDLSS